MHLVSSHNRVRGCLQCEELIPKGATVFGEVYCSEACEIERRERAKPRGRQATYLAIQERRMKRKARHG